MCLVNVSTLPRARGIDSNNYTKTQRDTKKRKERRKKPTNLASHQTSKEEKYIKKLSNKNLTLKT